MNALLGRKEGMTQVFSDTGEWTPVTVVSVGPCLVTAVRTVERDGYTAYQIGFEESKAKHVAKPQRGAFEKAGLPLQRHLRENRVDAHDYQLGDRLTASVFEAGEIVDVVGISKGKGFQGTIKRHNFSRGPTSHGSMNVRRPGSIGMSATPARVIKGMKMSGHMGAERHTTRNLELVEVDAEAGRLLIKGAVPGANGGLVFVRHAVTGPGVALREADGNHLAPEPIAAEEEE